MSESPARFELPARWKLVADDFVTALAASPDGALVAVGDASGAVTLVRASDGAVQWKRSLFAMGVLSLDWHPSGATVAASGQDRFAHVLERESGASQRKLDGGGPWIEHARWASHGKTLATAAGKVVRFWNTDGSPLLETPPHESTVAAIAWRKDGNELAAACYGGVYFWTPSRGASTRQFLWKGSLLSLAWSPDIKVLAASSQDCSVHFWRLSSGKDSKMTGYPFKPKALAWDAASSLLATGGDKTVVLWSFSGKGPEGSAPIELQAHQGLVTELAFHRSKCVLASGSEDASVILWEPRRGRSLVGYGFVEDKVSALAWAESDRIVVGDASGHVHCFSSDNSQVFLSH